jgi:tetratricopeptide (TPR) repeat protein
MSAPQSEQLDRFQANQDEFRNKALLQVAVTEALGFLNAGAPQEAIAHIQQYGDLAAKSHVGCYVFGLIYFNAEDLPLALTWFDRALVLRPAYHEALCARAVVLQRLGQPQDALESFEAVLSLRPNDAETLFSVGVILQSLGRMSDALAAYENALHWSPAHCEALTNRGALLDRFGRFDESLACFDRVAAIRPDDAANSFNRGSVLQKLGRHEDALAAYEEAARLGPPDAETELNRGNVLQKLGRLEEALVCYDLSSQYCHGYPQALYNKGIALQAVGRVNDALAAYDAALALDPFYCEAACNRGNVLHELGRLEDALAAYKDTLKIRPGFLPALINRANILLRSGHPEAAIASCDEVLRRDPKHPQSLGIRGAALHKLGRLEDALASLNEAVRFNPIAPDAWLNRGNVLQELDRHPEAIACYHEALRMRLYYPEALSSLGVALKDAGEIDRAIIYFDEALKHKPDYPDARNNRAGALLLHGDLKAGFEDFESRWDRSNAPPKTLVSELPVWEGQNIAGQAIVVWDEQGLGDLIQFSRYVLCLVEAGADVTLLCRKTMHRLLHTLPKPVRLVEALDPSEPFAFQIALMSLPRNFQTTLETIPATIPYLHPEPALVGKWANRIGRHGFRIGVCWQGQKFINLQRSFPLACLAPLAAIEGVRLISLMKDQGPIEVAAADSRFNIESLGGDFDAGPESFIDSAAAMENLDLVVTSDTSIAHLAGALGRPVFLALKHVPDWRWLMHREDSPWYPTMRLFRQAEKGGWDGVFKRIALEVEACMTEARQMTGSQAPKIAIPSAVGELIDKITILEIKENLAADATELGNISRELALLRKLKTECGFAGEQPAKLEAELKAANSLLRTLEDAIREHEARNDFGAGFVSLARQVYKTNDRRKALKEQLNALLHSVIITEI